MFRISAGKPRNLRPLEVEILHISFSVTVQHVGSKWSGVQEGANASKRSSSLLDVGQSAAEKHRAVSSCQLAPRGFTSPVEQVHRLATCLLRKERRTTRCTHRRGTLTQQQAKRGRRRRGLCVVRKLRVMRDCKEVRSEGEVRGGEGGKEKCRRRHRHRFLPQRGKERPQPTSTPPSPSPSGNCKATYLPSMST